MVVVSSKSTKLNEFLGIFLLALTIVITLSLISYSPRDPSLNVVAYSDRPNNYIGVVGAYLADLLFQAFGVSAFFIPFVVAVVAWRRFRSLRLNSPYIKGTGFVLLICAISTFLSLGTVRLPYDVNFPSGGVVGMICAAHLTKYFNLAGSLIVLSTLVILSLLACTRFSFAATGDWIESRPRSLIGAYRDWRDRVRRKKLNQLKEEMTKVNQAMPAARVRATENSRSVAETVDRMAMKSATAAPALPKASPPAEAPAAGSFKAAKSTETIPITMWQPKLPTMENMESKERLAAPETDLPTPAFKFPDIEFLSEPSGHHVLDEPALRDLAKKITEKCAEFGVLGNIVQIHPGPVVTTFEFKPDPGIKYSRIINLIDDICLAMKAESIRIDRIPGKSTVGIEVPNEHRETIYLREIIGADPFRRSASKLTLALGKQINGDTYITDLARMPHLLIAGATGAGKSVAVNSIITSILYKATPDEVKFIMVDPKRLELGLYAEIPHLLTPIVTEVKLAANALNWAVGEMEERYKRLAFYSVRNIDQYNNLVRASTKSKVELENEDCKPLPYIVVIIDELADLMLLAGREVETAITRLAQMARAVGIHLILSTQRPSVDVITGLIKANFPSRISFRVSSKVDSRTILDCNGSEALLGNGDMLFLPPGSARLIRVHGAFVSEKEAERIITFLKNQGPPNYKEEILEFQKEEKKEGVDDEVVSSDDLENADDPLYEDAVRVVVEMGKASTSVLQRRLKIGYGRAARLLDIMQHEGIVGPPDASKPREVLVSRDYFHEIDTREPFD